MNRSSFWPERFLGNFRSDLIIRWKRILSYNETILCTNDRLFLVISRGNSAPLLNVSNYIVHNFFVYENPWVHLLFICGDNWSLLDLLSCFFSFDNDGSIAATICDFIFFNSLNAYWLISFLHNTLRLLIRSLLKTLFLNVFRQNFLLARWHRAILGLFLMWICIYFLVVFRELI